MSPPNQGYKFKASLTAAATDGTGVLVAACGASRGGGIQISGTWSGTVLFEQSLDSGTTWIAKTVYPALGGAGATSAAASGQWKFACGGETHIRARCSVFTTGPIVVDLALTAGLDEAVAGSGAAGAPIGGGITWGAPTAVVSAAGASQTFIPATAGRKAAMYWSPAGNGAAGYSLLAGDVVTLAAGIPLFAGAAPSVLTGTACPVTAITAIWTSGQTLYYTEGT